jgi:hypothetical protein
MEIEYFMLPICDNGLLNTKSKKAGIIIRKLHNFKPVIIQIKTENE